MHTRGSVLNVRCYSVDIRTLPALAAESLRELLREMPEERAKKLHAYRQEEDRRRCLAGWLLMRRFLGRDLPSRLQYGRYGKPRVRGGPYFSLSHSGRYAVLAVAPVPVGVDVELRREEEDLAALAAVAFHPEEREYYARSPVAEVFYALWTLKESYLKLCGTGLAVEPASFALSLEEGGARLPGRQNIRFRLYDDLPGYSLALCLAGGEAPAEITPVSFQWLGSGSVVFSGGEGESLP